MTGHQFDDSPYTQLTTPARGDVQGVIKDISEALPENQTKFATQEDLHQFGSWASTVRAVTASGTVTLVDTDPMFIEIDPDGADRDVSFPAKSDDNHAYMILNSGSSNRLVLKRSDGTFFGSIPPGEVKHAMPSTINDFNLLTGRSSGIGKNILPNGGFQVAQRGAGPFTSATTFVNNDDAYLLDGCVFLANGSDTCDVSQVADDDFVSGYKIRMDVETANRRFGILLPVENKDIQAIVRSGVASFQFKMKRNGASVSNVRAYLLEWRGTADAITSDVISSWGSAGADPTLVANWYINNTASNIPFTGTTTTMHEIENIAVTSSATNLAVLLIIDDTDANVADYVEFGDIKLEEGAVCTPFENDVYADALAKCQRYCFLINTAATTLPGVKAASNSIQFFFPIRMRIAPAITTSGFSWVTTTPAANQVGAYEYASAAWLTITGALSFSSGVSLNGVRVDFNAGTSFSGTVGAFVNVWLGAFTTAPVLLSAEL